MIVNPAPGALVRDPATSLAVEAGAEIDPTEPYWSRLLADRDLIEAPGDQVFAPEPPATPAGDTPHTDEDDA